MAPPIGELVGHHRTDGREFLLQRRIHHMRGLHVILSAEVHTVPGFHRTNQRESVPLPGKLRIQLHRPLHARFDLANIKVFRRPFAFLEIPGIDVGLPALQHDEDDEARGPAGLYFRLGVDIGGFQQRQKPIRADSRSPNLESLAASEKSVEKTGHRSFS